MKIKTYYQNLACEDDLKSEPFQQVLLEKWLIKFPKKTKILDFGSGLGFNLKTLLKMKFKNIYACDISRLSAKKIRKIYPSVKFILLNNYKLPYPDQYFDLIIATEVLEHVPNYGQTLNELKRVLKTGGFLNVSSPNYFNLTGLLKLWYDYWSKERSWNPWKIHKGGSESLITFISFNPYLRDFKLIKSAGLDFYFAWLYWLPKRFLRFRRFFINTPGKWPIFKYFAMNYCQLLEKK